MPASRLIFFLLGVTALRAAELDNTQSVTLESVAWGLQKPVAMVDDGTGRLLVAEQRGTIRLIEDGKLAKNPVLDLSASVEFGGECGLLGLALHPDFSRNGRVFVNYTTNHLRAVTGDSQPVPHPVMQTVVAEFMIEPRTLTADPKLMKEVLRFDQPFLNHNGGDLKFGPDGMLYVSTGDGGGRADPMNNAQSLGNLLGKILRVDVNGKQPGAIPADNPFVKVPGARGEIWAYGLRDPRQFSFDRVTGELYAGDAGESTWEEIDLIEKGKNYGWSAREGAHDLQPDRATGPTVDPIKEYGRTTGDSVVGGYVYRGKRFPWLDGMYLYADFDAQRVFGLRRVGMRFDAALVRAGFPIRAFGEDHDGELYVLNYEGEIYRLVVTDAAARKKPP
jgi:glucose/arabinose dehydrogenase